MQVEHDGLRLADCQPADRVALQMHRRQRFGRAHPQRRIVTALDDAEHRLARLVAERGLAALGPAQRKIARARDLGRLGGQRHAFVELHLDVGIEQALDLDRALRRQLVDGAVEMRAKSDAALVEFSQLRQRHHLEAAGIGEDGPGPAGEFVQPAELGHALRARPQHQVIRVTQDDVGAERMNLVGIHGLDGAAGAHRHEGRRAHHPTRHGNFTTPRLAVGGQEPEGELGGHACIPARPRTRKSLISVSFRAHLCPAGHLPLKGGDRTS